MVTVAAHQNGFAVVDSTPFWEYPAPYRIDVYHHRWVVGYEDMGFPLIWEQLLRVAVDSARFFCPSRDMLTAAKFFPPVSYRMPEEPPSELADFQQVMTRPEYLPPVQKNLTVMMAVEKIHEQPCVIIPLRSPQIRLHDPQTRGGFLGPVCWIGLVVYGVQVALTNEGTFLCTVEDT